MTSSERGEDLQNPQLWYARARETRLKAEKITSPEIKSRMLAVSREYGRLADLLETDRMYHRIRP
jgi:hypothetical protein